MKRFNTNINHINKKSIVNPWNYIAIDSGGTFTDVIALVENKIEVFKVPSTPKNPENAVISALTQLNGGKEIFHGTTVATNAILERKGAKVLLITTKGFRDMIEIGRQNRDDIYALYPSRTEPLVESDFRLEAKERILSDGSILENLNHEELLRLRKIVESLQPDVIAVSLLFSFLNNIHEMKIKEFFADDYIVSISSEVFPEYREYERTSTVVIDAYIKPVMNRYLNQLNSYIKQNKLGSIISVMKSDKGLALANSVAKRPVDTIFSGLAGGVKAAELTSELLKDPNILAIDIGGTSTDVSAVINGKVAMHQFQKVDGLPVGRPSVDVATIGSGGGSLVKYENGLIRVGPQSAGADPGPICYDQGGTIPTITDVDLVFGILPQELAGGRKTLNRESSLRGIKEFAHTAEISINQVLTGVRRIFHENIAGAIRSVSTQRGYDPREFSLLAFGGAGPVHGVEIAEVMGITKVIIPPFPGIWSSVGLLGGDYEYTSSSGMVKHYTEVTEREIEERFDKLQENVNNQALLDEVSIIDEIYVKTLSLRFVGQSYELRVPYSGKEMAKNDFLKQHRHHYGFAAENEPIELVSLNCQLVIPHQNPQLPPFQGSKQSTKQESREVEDQGMVEIHKKDSLELATIYKGPKIIQQDDTTVFIPKAWHFEVDNLGFIHIIKA